MNTQIPARKNPIQDPQSSQCDDNCSEASSKSVVSDIFRTSSTRSPVSFRSKLESHGERSKS